MLVHSIGPSLDKLKSFSPSLSKFLSQGLITLNCLELAIAKDDLGLLILLPPLCKY